MLQTRTETFIESYGRNLKRAVEEYPNDYAFHVSHVPTVLERMTKAIQERSFNKDSHAFRWTCKELGIPHTYKAIYAYLEG